jgi:hypothetical protein
MVGKIVESNIDAGDKVRERELRRIIRGRAHLIVRGHVAIGQEAIAMTAGWHGSGPTSPYPIGLLPCRHANVERTSLGHAARASAVCRLAPALLERHSHGAGPTRAQADPALAARAAPAPANSHRGAGPAQSTSLRHQVPATPAGAEVGRNSRRDCLCFASSGHRAKGVHASVWRGEGHPSRLPTTRVEADCFRSPPSSRKGRTNCRAHESSLPSLTACSRIS